MSMTRHPTPLRVTVSGSFRRHMSQISEDVATLVDLGALVLSPSDPRVVDAFGDFLYVASDHHRTVRRLQDRHLAAIETSDFLWLVSPGGYVGTSVALEIGVAVTRGIPVYSAAPPSDLTIRQYVRLLAGPAQAIELTRCSRTPRPAGNSLLLTPSESVESAHRALEDLGSRLLATDLTHREHDEELDALAERVRSSLRYL